MLFLNKKSFTYNTLFMTGANIITRIAGFLYRIFISRCVGAEGLGLFALITPVYSVCCALVASGIPIAAMKKISEASSPSRRKALTYAALKTVLAISVFLFAALLIFSKPLSRLLGDVRTYPSLLILSFAVLITGFENVYKSSFYSDGIVRTPAVTEICEQLLRTVSVVLLLIFASDRSSTAASAVLTLGIVIGEALSLAVLFASYSHYTSGIRCERLRLAQSEILSIAAPVTAAKTAESFLSSLSNILIPYLLVLSGLSRSEATGALGVISGMIMPLLYMPCVFTNAVSVNLVPYISENLAHKNISAVIRKCRRVFFVTSLFAFPCTFFMIAFRRFIAEALFSDSRVELFLPVMAIGGLAAIFRHILSSVMNACGKEKRASVYSFYGNTAELLLTVALTPFMGAYGYTAAYAAANIFMLVPSAITVCHALNISGATVLYSLTPAFPALFCSLASSLLLSSIITECGLVISTLIAAFFGVFSYFTAVYLTVLKKKIIFFSEIT